jgi:tetratricopeptide (TPR) repeat protein
MKRQNAAFEKEMAAIEKIQAENKIEPFFLGIYGRLYARSDKLKEAGRVLETLRSMLGELLAASGVARSDQSDQASFHRLKGEIELARQQYEEALDSFGLVANLKEIQVEDCLALAYFKSGNVDKAIEKYREFIQKKDALGHEAQEPWILAHYQLGILYEKKGDQAEAVKALERFLEIWKDADPDIPEVVDAKRRLERLKPR